MSWPSRSPRRCSIAPAISGPDDLRTVDAVHLAAALSIGPDLATVVTYDRQLRAAALANGLDVESPG